MYSSEAQYTTLPDYDNNEFEENRGKLRIRDLENLLGNSANGSKKLVILPGPGQKLWPNRSQAGVGYVYFRPIRERPLFSIKERPTLSSLRRQSGSDSMNSRPYGLVTIRGSRQTTVPWSVGCGIICSLMLALWVRSYRNHEAVWFNGTGNITTGAASTCGSVVFEWLQLDPGVSPAGWHYANYGIPESKPRWFKWESGSAYGLFSVPIWSLCVLSIACGAIPWMRWRFSLRTLLIAMTLVAIVLGLIVWLARR